MRDNRQIVALTQMGNLHPLRNSPHARHVRLQESHGLAIHEIPESEASEQVFANRNWNGQFTSQNGMPLNIFSMDRFLKPIDIEFLEALSPKPCCIEVPGL